MNCQLCRLASSDKKQSVIHLDLIQSTKKHLCGIYLAFCSRGEAVRGDEHVELK